MDEKSISTYLDDPERRKILDDYRDFIIHQLKCFPNLSAVKVQKRYWINARIWKYLLVVSGVQTVE